MDDGPYHADPLNSIARPTAGRQTILIVVINRGTEVVSSPGRRAKLAQGPCFF
jgi:hypothetical protein